MQVKEHQGTEASPLGPAIARFARKLESHGYPKSTREQYLSICRAFDRSVQKGGIAVSALDDDHVEAFLVEATAGRKLREGGRLKRGFWRRPIALLFDQLRSHGLLAAVETPATSPVPGVAQYLAFLREHRGFSERTVARQQLQVSRLLAHLGVDSDKKLERISVGEIDRYLVHAARGLGRQSMGAVCASIRGFLGHLHLRGILHSDLRAQVATPHLYALEDMPRSVAWSEIDRTLGAIDRETEVGCRDYAMLALIAYCGLRAGDVAALELGQIDWRRDTIHAPRPKSGTSENVPLIPSVGEALVTYLRRRPDCRCQKVFVTVYAPIRPVADRQVSQRARFYLQRAGVKAPKLGSHTLRHTFAVRRVLGWYREGADVTAKLPLLATYLGHGNVLSTHVYLTATAELLREASGRFERVYGSLVVAQEETSHEAR